MAVIYVGCIFYKLFWIYIFLQQFVFSIALATNLFYLTDSISDLKLTTRKRDTLLIFVD